MGGLAALAREAGHKVTGCDAGVYPPMSEQLRALGIDLIEGFGAEQLALQPDMFVIGNVVSRARLADGSAKFPLMDAILHAGLPYTSGPQWLAEHVLQGRHVLAVAGTHGKTTTTSMLAWILECAGLQPGFLVGGVPLNFGVSARLGASVRPTAGAGAMGSAPLFVIEADEYDTAFFDKRSKFVHYRPRTAILNNLEFDHADIFADLDAIQTQFHHLVRTVPSDGLIVANGREESIHETLDKGCWTPVELFGNQAGWQIGEADEQGGFDVFFKGEQVGHIAWALLGEHNRMNALAVIAAARHVGVGVQTACEALGQFQNVKRRMEIKGTVNGVTVYDDFAHHPTAIATTVAGLRQKVGNARILAVLEPRSNTMKLGTMKAALPESLRDADQVFCYAGGVDWDVAEALAPLGDKLHVGQDFDTFVVEIVKQVQSGDQILVMSNGGFGGIHDKILAALAA